MESIVTSNFIKPQEVVSEYREVYKKNFMHQSLKQILKESEGKYHAYDEDSKTGFKGSEIILKFQDLTDCSDVVYASNEVQILGNGKHLGMIFACNSLLHAPKSLLKMVLAHEWIEVMKGFKDKARPEKSLIGPNKVDLIILFNNLKRRAIWQDTDEFERDLFLALKELLVSNESLKSYLKEHYGLDFIGLQKLSGSDTAEALTIVTQLAKLFSVNCCVEEEQVLVKIQDMLYGSEGSEVAEVVVDKSIANARG